MMLSDHHIADLCDPDIKYTKIIASTECSTSKSDVSIIKYDVLCTVRKFNDKSMIDPFVCTSVRVNEKNEKIVSYGLSSYGYDIRLQPKFDLFQARDDDMVIDPRNPDQNSHFSKGTVYADEVILPPGGFLLGVSIETFNIPRNILATCLGKSSLARCGVSVLVTPLEPEWSGQLVVEIHNTTPSPVIIRANEGIAQLIFNVTSDPCVLSYSDRNGKYQNQQGILGNQL